MENAVSTIDDRIKVFMTLWRDVEKEIKDLYVHYGLGESDKKYNVRTMVDELITKNVLSPEFIYNLDPIGKFRNKLIHYVGSIDQEEISNMTIRITDFYNKYIWYERPFIK